MEKPRAPAFPPQFPQTSPNNQGTEPGDSHSSCSYLGKRKKAQFGWKSKASTYWSWWCLQPGQPWSLGRNHQQMSCPARASGSGCGRRCRRGSPSCRGPRWSSPRLARSGSPLFAWEKEVWRSRSGPARWAGCKQTPLCYLAQLQLLFPRDQRTRGSGGLFFLGQQLHDAECEKCNSCRSLGQH